MGDVIAWSKLNKITKMVKNLPTTLETNFTEIKNSINGIDLSPITNAIANVNRDMAKDSTVAKASTTAKESTLGNVKAVLDKINGEVI